MRLKLHYIHVLIMQVEKKILQDHFLFYAVKFIFYP